jgi:ATP-binding cassette subfamily B protein
VKKQAVKKEDIKDIFSLTHLFIPYKKDIILAGIALFVTALMILFFGRAIKYLIDFGFAAKSVFFLNLFLLIFLFSVLIMALAGYYRSLLINRIAENIVCDLRKKAFTNLIQLSAEFFEINKVGDIISRMTADTIVIHNIIANNSSFFLRNSILFFGGIISLFFVSFKLTIISLILILVSVSPIFLMLKKIKIYAHHSQNALSRIASHIEEVINGVKTIQSYLCEKKEIENFNNFVEEGRKITLEKIRLRSLMISLVIALAFGSILVVLWFGGHDVISGKMTSGDLSSFVFYSVITATALVSLSQISGQMQSVLSAKKRIFELIEMRPSVQDSKNPKVFSFSEKIKIEMRNVDFSYPARKNSLAIKNFNLVIAPKERIAIAGSSGSGKSTILQLLLRFYDVNSGLITINDEDIKLFSLADLRKNFSYISQDCFIFSDTVFENIAYFDKSITKQEVLKIIEENPTLDFIKNLPNGLDSFVGQKGVQLSGGEKQRISIARAIIKNSPVLLLDEATSALDNTNEHMISLLIDNLAKNKTVITIAHKLSSLINANRIIFLNNGEISEIGSHEELIAKNGLYKKMYEQEIYQI